MKRQLFIVFFGLLLTVTVVQAKQLWQYGTFEERRQTAFELGLVDTPVEYTGSLEQNLPLIAWYQENDKEGVLGATLLVAGTTYNLAGVGISSSATSITLQSLTLPQNGYLIQDADLSDTFYITLEPGNKTRQEIVSCTTVVNTGSNPVLSGCTRGLSPITPYTASTTLQFSHAGGSQVIFSDPPQLFNQFGALDAKNTWTNTTVFSSTTSPFTRVYFGDNSGAYFWYNTSTDQFGWASSTSEFQFNSNGTQFGAIPPLTLVGGELKLATTTGHFVLDGSNTFGINASSTGGIVIDSNGVAVDWADQFAFSGNVKSASTTLGTGNTLITGGTTTTGSFNVGGTLLRNGSVVDLYTMATSTVATSTHTGNATTTLATYSLPANSIGKDGMVEIEAAFDIINFSPYNDIFINVAYGGQTVCEFLGLGDGNVQRNHVMNCKILSDDVVTRQVAYGYMIPTQTTSQGWPALTTIRNTLTVNSATAQNIVITASGQEANDEVDMISFFVRSQWAE